MKKIFVKDKIQQKQQANANHQNLLKLSSNDIYDKQFAIVTGTKGYSIIEVDNFLDIIINDYNTFIKVENILKEKNTLLLKENEELKAKISLLQENNNILENQSSKQEEKNFHNIDIIKRLSELEKEVFKKNK